MATVYWATRRVGSSTAGEKRLARGRLTSTYWTVTSARYSAALSAATCMATRRYRIMLAAMIGSR